MNVLGIYYRHKPGGFCKRLYRLYMALAEAGHKVHYISTEILPVHHRNIIPHVIRIPFRDSPPLLFWFFFTLCVMPYLCYLSRKLKIEAVMAMGAYYGFLNGFNKTLNNLTLITFIRGRDAEYSCLIGRPCPLIWFQKLYEHISFYISDLIITVNRTLKKELGHKYPRARIEVIPNNIEAPERSGSNFRKEINVTQDTFLISTSGVFTKGKNIDLLIKAFFGAKLENTLLIIVGDISTRDLYEREKLETLTENLEISDRVVFTGWRTDMGDVIGSTGLFVLPSISEGCPNALLEALGLGVACLGSRIPEIKEILFHEEILFDPANEVELTQKLVSSTKMETLALWHKLCEKRRAVYTFDWDKRVIDTLRQAGVGA